MRVWIDVPTQFVPLYQMVLEGFAHHYHISFSYVWEKGESDLTISSDAQADIRLSALFLQQLEKGDLHHSSVFNQAPLIYNHEGDPDYLSSCAYMMAFLQELDLEAHDHDLKRFRYVKSFQSRFNCNEENLVLTYFQGLKETTTPLSAIRPHSWTSRIFVSHDIDQLYHSVLPELKTAIRKVDLPTIFSLLTQQLLKDQDKRLFNRILAINSRYDVHSTFFWMVENHRFQSSSGSSFDNANYKLTQKHPLKSFHHVLEAGQSVGIHKSLGSPGLSDEISRFPHPPIATRNHYLHGPLLDTLLESAHNKIQLECTAGFSEKMGFRNCYGSPYRPYHWSEKRMLDTMVVPLHIMDATFMNAHKSGTEATENIINFISNHQDQCILSLLWHNNYFSEVKYPEWLNAYKEILHFCWENQIYSITPHEILSDFQ